MLGLLSCNKQTEKKVDNSTITKTANDKIKLHKLEKLFVVGDFDGDKKQDTIFQHNYSKLTRTEIPNSVMPRRSILIAHDESTYRSGELPNKRWIFPELCSFYNKGLSFSKICISLKD